MILEIPVELLVFLAVLFIVVIWLIYYKISLKRLVKKYKPENDRSKKGGFEERAVPKGAGTGEPNTPTTEPIRKPEEPRELSVLDVAPDGQAKPSTREDSNSNRKTRSSLRSLYRRRRKE